jgi:hypothetical protein
LDQRKKSDSLFFAMENYLTGPNVHIRFPPHCPPIVAQYIVHWKNHSEKYATKQTKIKIGPLINFFDEERKVHVNLIKKLHQYFPQYPNYDP